MKLTIRSFALFIVAAVILVLPTLLFAQTCTNGFCPLAPSDGSKIGTLYSSSPDLATYLSNLFAAALSIGAILAVLRLTYAGYQYMTSDAWSSKHHAKEIIGNTVLGLLLLLSIYLILYQINPNLLKLDFLQNVKVVPGVSGNNSGTSGGTTRITITPSDRPADVYDPAAPISCPPGQVVLPGTAACGTI